MIMIDDGDDDDEDIIVNNSFLWLDYSRPNLCHILHVSIFSVYQFASLHVCL